MGLVGRTLAANQLCAERHIIELRSNGEQRLSLSPVELQSQSYTFYLFAELVGEKAKEAKYSSSWDFPTGATGHEAVLECAGY
jgi:hypothetical protein